METPLTPLDFMRRARKLHARREAVVDGDLRLTYEQFFERCDRWSAALQRLGVRKGDRVAYIAPNTHAQLESFYAVPQIGAVLVPINYRLTADDFAYIIDHSGANVVCVHARLPRRRRQHPRPHPQRASTSSPWRARATAGSTTRRCSPPRLQPSSGRRSPRATCSPSTTPAARPRGRRA